MQKLNSALLLCALLFSTQSQAWQDTETSITVKGHVIHGSLAKPKDSDTVILIIAGSGPTDRDGNQAQMKSNAYLMLAQDLYQAGYATLRYDKRGIGASTESKVDMSQLRFKDYVDDAKVWVDELSTQFKHVILAGHSIGGLMALQVAQDKPVQAVISLAGMANSGYDTLKRQLGGNQPEFVTAAALPLLEKLAQNESIPAEDVPPFLYSIFHPNLQGYLKSFLNIDPKKELSKVKQPVLLVIGETDIQITVEETKNMAQGKPTAELVIIPEMNHVLKVAPIERMANLATYQNPELSLHKDLMPKIETFLANL
ncbi:alpha/beta hydrolase [Marinicella rhabdoformis]|uniref:alpha/beta hydrolase n=1 Tax=Marinicella rhabdoformis TaxID=2580566 RepID=UPI0012AECBB9|nr:alpha/beta fold hydrolase [Marinicella rhabdoformis]